MGDILNFIQANFGLILVGVAVFLILRFAGGAISGMSQLFNSTGPAIAAVAVVFVIAVAAIAIVRPQFFAFLFSAAGPIGPERQVQQAKADLVGYALDPMDNPAVWNNQTAQAVAEAVASEYKFSIAKNKASISAAEAERLSHLPKGHPDRDLWDKAGIDPAVGSLPPIVQVASQSISKISISEERLSRPVGIPPFSEKWIQAIYQLPLGVVYLAAIMSMMIIVGISFKLVR